MAESFDRLGSVRSSCLLTQLPCRFEVYLMVCKFCLTGLPLFIRWQAPTLNVESLGAATINVVTIMLVGSQLPYRHQVDAIMQQAARE